MTVRIINADVIEGLRQLPDESVHCVAALSETQIAYLAGLIDGEGSLECHKEMQLRGATPRYALRLSFVFSTKEPTVTIARWLGREAKEFPATDPSRSSRWRVHIYKATTVALLRRALPYLILKKEQAQLIMSIEEVRYNNTPSRHHFGSQAGTRMPEHALNEMDCLWLRLRSLKTNKRRMDARVNAT